MRWLRVLIADAVLFAAAYAGAFVLRFDGYPTHDWLLVLARTLPLVVAIQLAAFIVFRLHRHLWRYVSIGDLVRIGEAAILSGLVEFAIFIPWLHGSGPGYPRSVIFINMAILVLLSGGARFAVRLSSQRSMPSGVTEKRVAIVGAGSAADAVLREMMQRAELGYRPQFLVDDSSGKIGSSMHGVPIAGPIRRLPELARAHSIDEVIIAIPSATRAQMQAILEAVGQTGLPSKTVPAVGDLINGTVSVSRLRRVEIADLLNRDQVSIDPESVAAYIQGRRVLITGAGGSIGTELCRQVLQVGPRQLIMLTRGENSLYQGSRRLRSEFPDAEIRLIQADVVNREKLDRILSEYRPEAIFHAAANKHVPLSELNLDETFLVNVVGTWHVLESAAAHSVSRVVCISTDKAAEPASAMGASKRIAEMLVLQAHYPKTICTAVRFGNVLGSRGSVVPLFEEQIAQGRPVTVTDPEMTRYFMTIPEAAQLVLQAGAFSRGGDLFLLEMGEPIKIIDLARQMIRLSGLRPDEDIPIQVIGRRPGEKLHETLINPCESFEPTAHPKIRRVRAAALAQITPADIEELLGLCRAMDEASIRSWILRRIPEFDPQLREAGRPGVPPVESDDSSVEA